MKIVVQFQTVYLLLYNYKLYNVNMRKENLPEYEKLKENLYELRTQNGWTQSDVAIKLGISYQSYQAYERGVAVPTLQNFIKLANLYDVSLDFLVGKKEY